MAVGAFTLGESLSRIFRSGLSSQALVSSGRRLHALKMLGRVDRRIRFQSHGKDFPGPSLLKPSPHDLGHRCTHCLASSELPSPISTCTESPFEMRYRVFVQRSRSAPIAEGCRLPVVAKIGLLWTGKRLSPHPFCTSSCTALPQTFEG